VNERHETDSARQGRKQGGRVSVKLLISRVCGGLGVALLLGIILAAGGILLMQCMGHSAMAVLSGSMEPAYRTGGLVFIDTNAVPADIKPGDPIAFQLNEKTVVTHRVLAVDGTAQVWLTKGDANAEADLSPVPFESLLGRAGLHVPYLGYALMNLKTTRGFAAGAILLALLIILFAIPMLLAPAKDKTAGAGKKQRKPRQTARRRKEGDAIRR
jgi:signal peptidase